MCPFCGRTVKSVRLFPDTAINRLNVYCRSCKRGFDIQVSTGQRHNRASAIVQLL